MNREHGASVAADIRYEGGAHWEQTSWWRGRTAVGFEADRMPVRDLTERKCGTKGCVAGHAAARQYPDGIFYGKAGILAGPSAMIPVRIRDAAQEYLEITEEQKYWLFSSSRELREILAALENDAWPDLEGSLL